MWKVSVDNDGRVQVEASIDLANQDEIGMLCTHLEVYWQHPLSDISGGFDLLAKRFKEGQPPPQQQILPTPDTEIVLDIPPSIERLLGGDDHQPEEGTQDGAD